MGTKDTTTEAEDATTKTTETKTETPEAGTDANTGASNTGEETPPTLPKTQKDLDGMFADRAGRAKRNALSDLAKSLEIGDVTELGEIVKSHKQAEEKRIADEEAQKSELQKKDDLLTASAALQTTQAQTIKTLRIENAIMRIAPGKNIPADRFADLLTLMDTTAITITEGVVADKDIEDAIDTTLKERDYLTAKGNGSGIGSPPSARTTAKTKQAEAPQPVKRKYGGI